MSGVTAVYDSTSNQVVYPDSWPHIYAYNADGKINYDSITDGVSTWRQTYSYADGKMVGLSAWVKQ